MSCNRALFVKLNQPGCAVYGLLMQRVVTGFYFNSEAGSGLPCEGIITLPNAIVREGLVVHYFGLALLVNALISGAIIKMPRSALVNDSFAFKPADLRFYGLYKFILLVRLGKLNPQ